MEQKTHQGITTTKLPPGFRFHPTDEELVLQYLRRKVFSFPIPSSIIPEFDVNKSDPWDLPGDGEQERYFFSKKEIKYPNGNRSNRATNCGYWKATGLDKQIIVRNHVVGMKKTLVFYLGKPPKGSKTDWVMHEYRLNNVAELGPLSELQTNWVLCRMLLKKRKSKKPVSADGKNQKQSFVFYDFMAKEKADSSSGSSGVTQILIRKQQEADDDKNEEEEEEEESSSCNSFTMK